METADVTDKFTRIDIPAIVVPGSKIPGDFQKTASGSSNSHGLATFIGNRDLHMNCRVLSKIAYIPLAIKHAGHDGDHRIMNEEMRNIVTRLDRQAKVREEWWKRLQATVLEAMGYRQQSARRIFKVARLSARSRQLQMRKGLTQDLLDPANGPASTYRGLRLNNEDIRLFLLQPQSEKKPVTGAFIVVGLDKRPTYTALSYTWGDQNSKRTIHMGTGAKVLVGDSLWCFLRLQSAVITQPTFFWIDAICIDQSNLGERNHQVGLMRKIYSCASRVFVWLGNEVENSDLATKLITKQATKPLRRRGPGYYPLWSREEGRALHVLCERPYWRRMWIIQELLHANNITVWCGPQSFQWDDFEVLYHKLKKIEESNWFAHHVFLTTVVQSPAAMMLWQRAHWRHPETPVPTLQTLIEIFRDWQCTDVRDRVFALSGMATLSSSIVPDYSLSTKEVYMAVLARVEGHNRRFPEMLSQILGLPAREVKIGQQKMYSIFNKPCHLTGD